MHRISHNIYFIYPKQPPIDFTKKRQFCVKFTMGAWKYSLNEIFLKAISLSIFIHFLKLCTILIGEKSSFKWVPISPLDALFKKIYFPSLTIYQVKYQYQICFRASKIPSKAWVNNLVTWSIVISETIPPFNSLGEVIYLENFSSFFFSKYKTPPIEVLKIIWSGISIG